MPFADIGLFALRPSPRSGCCFLMELILPGKREDCASIRRTRFGELDDINVRSPVRANQDAAAFNSPSTCILNLVEEATYIFSDQDMPESWFATEDSRRPDSVPSDVGSCP